MTGNEAYCKHGGLSHGHRQHAQKIGKDSACGSGDICILNGEENPFPVIRDATYRKHVGGGRSHRHRQHAQQNLAKIAHVVLEISSWTHRQTYSSQYFATAPTGDVTNCYVYVPYQSESFVAGDYCSTKHLLLPHLNLTVTLNTTPTKTLF